MSNESYPAPKAFKKSIRRGILEALKQEAESYRKFGDPKSDYRDAPEYLSVVAIAKHLSAMFPNTIRYRLEHHASRYAEESRADGGLNLESVGTGGRFDIVLMNASDSVPRYIIEVKRGPKAAADASRMLSFARLPHGRARWRHGFIVTIVRRTECQAECQAENFCKGLLEQPGVTVRRERALLGPAHGGGPDVQVWATVFQVSYRPMPDAAS